MELVLKFSVVNVDFFDDIESLEAHYSHVGSVLYQLFLTYA